MARPRLTKEAIAFIIERRDDPTTIYTWQDITDMIDERFGIKVSFQAVARNYHKYKDDKIIHQSKEPTKIEVKERPVFKSKKTVATLSEPLFERDEEVDLKNLFDKAE